MPRLTGSLPLSEMLVFLVLLASPPFLPLVIGRAKQTRGQGTWFLVGVQGATPLGGVAEPRNAQAFPFGLNKQNAVLRSYAERRTPRESA